MTVCSGGQKQRVAIARALAANPKILLSDEATSALDPDATESILNLLKDLNRKLGITIVIITHEMAVIKTIADRVAVMENGRIAEEGSVYDVFSDPKAEITKKFINSSSPLGKIERMIAEDSGFTRLRPGEKLVKLIFQKESVGEPVLTVAAQRFGVTLNIILANVEYLHGNPFGGTIGVLSGRPKMQAWIKEIAPNLYTYRAKFFTACSATVEMFWKAGLIAFVIGLLFGILLVITRKGGIRQNPLVYQATNLVINIFRSIPFIILLIFLIPLTRSLVGTAIGVKGAILPLVFGTVPFYSRQVEVALSGVEEGKIEAARSMGSGTFGLIFRVYLHEALPDLIRVTTVTAISLIGLTTMAGAVGAGGIGSFAINYGQNQNHQDIVNVCVIVLLVVTFLLQSLGNTLAKRTTNRSLFQTRHK